ncbi:MAG: cupin domain-containing protein [Betaproteobacteria bacterium]|nr:cupin domain-containing protein [Betaproteobacteria bacterium]
MSKFFSHDAPLPWLGGLSSRQFMQEHWQKKPLLVRGAFARLFAQSLPITLADVAQACEQGELPTRLVDSRFTVAHGPLDPQTIPGLQQRGWTILVQQMNTAFAEADEFLDHFRFIPEGRLDDLMTSVASDQGGIGAHVDSYDVFLVQAHGRRLWELAQRFDPTLKEGLDLRILKNFKAQTALLCEPGDLLYLPPGWAHRGVAIDPQRTGCMTYSVGFRAPDLRELADEAVGQHLDGLKVRPWADPWLEPSPRPGVLPNRLVEQMAQEAMQCLPNARQMARSVLAALSSPHPQIWVKMPNSPAVKRFAQTLAATKGGLALAPGARLLCWRGQFAANGELLQARGHTRELLLELATQRSLSAAVCRRAARSQGDRELLQTLFERGVVIFVTKKGL